MLLDAQDCCRAHRLSLTVSHQPQTSSFLPLPSKKISSCVAYHIIVERDAATKHPSCCNQSNPNKQKSGRQEQPQEVEEVEEYTTTKHQQAIGQNKLQTKKQKAKKQKMNIEDSNVVPHRSTNSTRQCLTSLSRREAVLSLWYGPSCQFVGKKVYKVFQYVLQVKAPDRIPFHKYISIKKTNFNSTRGI